MLIDKTFHKVNLSYQAGQSLIETVTAIFVLITGVAAGLTLAVYSFGSSSDVAEKISATGLAREGLEAVRRMRDSNWLVAGGPVDCGGGKLCYPGWLTAVYDISVPGGGAGSSRDFRLEFNPASSANKWVLTPASGGTDYRLYLQSGGGLSNLSSSSPTNLFRKITITYQSVSSPYNSASPLLRVRALVWWHGKNCPAITDLVNLNDTNCKVISEEYLTNWRNY